MSSHRHDAIEAGDVVAVVGAGPAGCAAAITLRQRGIPVVLVEGQLFPRHRPGETLHPGVAAILQQLGTLSQVEAASRIRHTGHWVEWGTRSGFVPYGQDERGSWKGFQVMREALDRIHLERARSLGVQVWQPCRATALKFCHERVIGLETDHGPIAARWVINATGSQGLLGRSLAKKTPGDSPRLFASYGYCRGHAIDHPAAPLLSADQEGWSWTAQLESGCYQWTRLSFSGKHERLPPPARLRGLAAIGQSRTAEVTWRCPQNLAGQGYFVAGDAAATLDPLTSHGVLRALMSGIMTAHLIARANGNEITEAEACIQYDRWLRSWYRSDLDQLKDFYRQLSTPPNWVTN